MAGPDKSLAFISGSVYFRNHRAAATSTTLKITTGTTYLLAGETGGKGGKGDLISVSEIQMVQQ